MNDIIGALGVLTMIGNYEDRLVRNTKSDEHGFELDTVAVHDRPWNYETAVKHKGFEFEEWIVLDGCDTKEDAEEMHERWFFKLLSGVDELTDIFTGDVFHKEG